MDVKPVCPYCGAEMKIMVQEFYGGEFCCGYAFCPQCGSYAPSVARDTSKEKLSVEIIAAALRRPAQKPLTWEEIPDHKLIFMELRGIDKLIPSILRQTIDDQAFYTMESGCVFTFAMDELGKRWRPWATEPTEEERAAAPWRACDADL